MKKPRFLAIIAGILSLIGILFLALFGIKSLPPNFEDVVRLKSRSDDERERIDRINAERKTAPKKHKDILNRYSKPLGILLVILMAGSLWGYYPMMVDGRIRDFGSATNYVRFLEEDRGQYQADVSALNQQIDLMQTHETTMSNIIALQDQELRRNPWDRFWEKIDFDAGLVIGVVSALGISMMVRNLK
jgi:hypothetical protein